MRQTLPTQPKRNAPSIEEVKLGEIFRHFQEEFPLDPIAAFAEFFAKRSHADCEGRGVRIYLRSTNIHEAEIRLCTCAEKRRNRFVLKALLFEAARERGGLAFAEGTICPASELKLPTNPRRELHRALRDEPTRREAESASAVAAAGTAS